MATNNSVTIVIPNWNGENLLKENLPKVIAAKNYPANNIKEIIIVDDASADTSVQLIKKKFAQNIRLFKHKENRGFAAAVNLGVRMAKSDLVCLLNTDVAPSVNFLEAALPHFKDKTVFGVTLAEKGYGPAIGKFKNGYVEHYDNKGATTTSNTFWLSGGSSILRRKVWMKLKGFDEELFHPFYWEDVDICYRALKRGYKLIWEPKCKVIHEHEVSMKKTGHSKKRKSRIVERNQLLFIWKNLTSKAMFKWHVRGLLRRTLRHPGYAIIVYMALKKRKLIKKRRKIELKQSKVSDEAIFASFS
jgi:GT2 family glycosyltransferase